MVFELETVTDLEKGGGVDIPETLLLTPFPIPILITPLLPDLFPGTCNRGDKA